MPSSPSPRRFPRLLALLAPALLLVTGCAGPGGQSAAPVMFSAPRSGPAYAPPTPHCPDHTQASATGCVHASDGFTRGGARVLNHRHTPTAGRPDTAALDATNMSYYGAPVKPVRCYGSGNALQVLYVYAEGQPNQVAAARPLLQRAVEQANGIVDRSAAGQRQLRVVTTGNPGQCRPAVTAVALPAADLARGTALAAPLKAKGFTSRTRKYLAFTEANTTCGLGETWPDARKGRWNPNNAGPMFARVDRRCWNSESAAHEIVHTLGAVFNDAPHASGRQHCTDDYDLMCYDDGGKPVSIVCPEEDREAYLDCGNDSYFNLHPAAGSYLARHWDVADSSFLYGGGAPMPTGKPAAPAGLHAAGVGARTITVAWRADPNAQYYSVWDFAQRRWVRTARTGYTLRGLRPYSRYEIGLSAGNFNGWSRTVRTTIVTHRS